MGFFLRYKERKRFAGAEKGGYLWSGKEKKGGDDHCALTGLTGEEPMC